MGNYKPVIKFPIKASTIGARYSYANCAFSEHLQGNKINSFHLQQSKS